MDAVSSTMLTERNTSVNMKYNYPSRDKLEIVFEIGGACLMSVQIWSSHVNHRETIDADICILFQKEKKRKNPFSPYFMAKELAHSVDTA